MCCLFGMMDYGHRLSARQKTVLLSVLAAECEARGTDAAGIAYNSGGQLHIYKRPFPPINCGFGSPARPLPSWATPA